jgi:hypothetical protein
MRWVVLLLGILGGLSSLLVGYLWLTAPNDPEIKQQIELSRAIVESAGKEKPASEDELVRSAKQLLAIYEGRVRASYFLLAGLAIGTAGGVLAFFGRTFNGAALMLLTVLGPVILTLPDLKSLLIALVSTSPLLVGGILCFLIRPKPVAQPA